MTKEFLTKVLIETEEAHKASGHTNDDWQSWYAEYILLHYPQFVSFDEFIWEDEDSRSFEEIDRESHGLAVK